MITSTIDHIARLLHPIIESSYQAINLPITSNLNIANKLIFDSISLGNMIYSNTEFHQFAENVIKSYFGYECLKSYIDKLLDCFYSKTLIRQYNLANRPTFFNWSIGHRNRNFNKELGFLVIVMTELIIEIDYKLLDSFPLATALSDYVNYLKLYLSSNNEIRIIIYVDNTSMRFNFNPANKTVKFCNEVDLYNRVVKFKDYIRRIYFKNKYENK